MKTITEILTELRELEIITFEDYKIVYEAYQNDNNDFTFEGSCGEYRVIADTEINEKLKEYFLSDEYLLGCFSADFISDITKSPKNLIEIIQEAGAYQELGEYIAENCDMDELTETVASWGGYGSFLSTYDGKDEEIKANGTWYHVFRQN